MSSAPQDGDANLTNQEEPPPILGSWRNLYWLLVVELVLLTLAGYVLTWWAA